MIGLYRGSRVFAYTEPADMRKQYDSLAALVMQGMDCDPLSGDFYLFTNRARTRAKVLHFDGTGLCIFAKRLEQGRFAKLWRASSKNTLQLSYSELLLFLEGSTLAGVVKLSPAPLDLEACTRSLPSLRAS